MPHFYLTKILLNALPIRGQREKLVGNQHEVLHEVLGEVLGEVLHEVLKYSNN